jgi:GTP-binding protein EngB required for normal cell division
MRVRLLLFIAVLLVAVVTLFLLLLATDTALSVWQRLQLAPLWLQVAYTLILLLISSATLWFTWRWLKPSRNKAVVEHKNLDPSSLKEALVKSADAGVDVSAAVHEIKEQRRRKQSGEIYIAIFGEISTGKSSLVKALLPNADLQSDPRGGTTLNVRHYRWQAGSGDTVIIADLPGFNLDSNPEILEEARRAHLVVFLCDSDITRSQMEQLKRLLSIQKPLIVALNKMDRFAASEAHQIAENIAQRTGVNREDVVFIQTGGHEEVITLLRDGHEEIVTRDRTQDIDSLRHALQRKLDGDHQLMEQLRDTAVLLLAAEKLEEARDKHREQQASELVTTYSKRAVVGALAAVAPGSDIIIQGLLATRLIQSLCKVYDVSVKEVEIESFLRLAGGKVKKLTAITLAITGNALKAFPGIGTLTGGLVHAVAYGMIFESLGRAAAQTLASRGDFRPYPAAKAFEEMFNDNLEAGAIRFAKLALAEKGKEKRP